MAKPEISDADIRRAHQAMRVATPLEDASPLMLALLAAVARHLLRRDQHHPWPRTARIDLKRRAAGDFDD